MRKVQAPCSCGDVLRCRFCRMYSIDPTLRATWVKDTQQSSFSGGKIGNGVGGVNGLISVPKVITNEPTIVINKKPNQTVQPSKVNQVVAPAPHKPLAVQPKVTQQVHNKQPRVATNGSLWVDAPTDRVVWAVGVTTVNSRLTTHLPNTLLNVCRAGFDRPVIYADCCTWEQHKELERRTGCEVHTRRGPGNAWSNYHGALCDLLVRNPKANRIVIFQDDIKCVLNLRQYLEHQRTSFPQRGYLNLYTSLINEKLVEQGAMRLAQGRQTGWHLTDQRGRGALALVFDRDGAEALMSHDLTGKRARSVRNSWVKNIDGWVREVLVVNLKYTEYCHNPSLVQHTGKGNSTLFNPEYNESNLYAGDYFDALSLLQTHAP